MNLFIDTNIFLSFYHLTSDDLEELKKLVVLLKKEEIKLLIPTQVISEFWRNRENKISDSLQKLRENSLNFQYPQLCKEYDEYKNLRDLQKSLKDTFNSLMKKITHDLKEHNLKADHLINNLFELGTNYASDVKIIEKAKLRIEIGNPPGKKGSLGYAINWETLLNDTPEGEDIFLVTSDKDFYSPLDENTLKEFLLKEWHDTKRSEIIIYKRLSTFFKDNYPDIKLASELEKELLIRKLSTCGNFASTHLLISRLSKYAEFSTIQINEIVSAYISNDQVYRTITDSDVKSFIERVIKDNDDNIEKDNLIELKELLYPPSLPFEEADPDELPF